MSNHVHAPSSPRFPASPMMPEHDDPVSGFFRLALTINRHSQPVSDLTLATTVQSFPGLIRTRLLPDGLIGTVVFVNGLVGCVRGARFLMLNRIRPAVREDHVARLYLAQPEWVTNMDSMLGFIEIYEDLSTPYQRLVDEIFRDDDMLRRFVSAPASMNGHHAYAGGLLDHAVDTAQIVGREVVDGRTSCDFDTAMTAALLHDLGKTMEYEASVTGSDHFSLSTRGVLVGHKLTGMELITQAAARLRDLAATSNAKVPGLTDDQLAALIHAVTACPAPDYAGLRSPITPEANLVAAADRMSADSHLYSTLAPKADAGADGSTPWGRSHWHLGRKRSRPYYVRQPGSAAA